MTRTEVELIDITPDAMKKLVQVDELTPTERGNGGFGSTGRTDFPETKPDPVPEWEE